MTRTTNELLRVGIDLGSTTIKIVVLDESDQIIYKKYNRHFSETRATLRNMLKELISRFGGYEMSFAITGSGGLSLAEGLGISFFQEVIACTEAVQRNLKNANVVIELGGEDAKITFLGKNIDQRMNGSCAGGTGAFLDQMAALLETSVAELNELAKNHGIIYPIASRCGVFAKTDIQAYLNEGAKTEDIAASIFQAVVNQTIGGLACGRKIQGNVAFLGGPLFFLDQLRERFIQTLNLTEEQILFPEDAQYYVAIGAAMLAGDNCQSLIEIYRKFKEIGMDDSEEIRKLQPLFVDENEYNNFIENHENTLERTNFADVKGPLFLGIDAGSTTTKAILLDEENKIVYQYYRGNKGTPLIAARSILEEIYSQMNSESWIKGACVTGYGEGLIQKALNVDFGEVETMAHYKGADYFLPGVDFILDIGGQDMKCLTTRNGFIEKILLNEACSSGCGSFLESFSKSLNIDLFNFVQNALYAKRPVDLGTRCTVFMNSKVKQAQKEGATIGDISAGLAYSVVKNALFKVIKIGPNNKLGEKIVVQGGTFYNDAVLRAFEIVTGKKVVRPEIAGLMGAFGCALIAKERQTNEKSSIISWQELRDLTYEIRHRRCKGCTNNCLLTVNVFSESNKYIAGNKCEFPLAKITDHTLIPNLYKIKNQLMFDYTSKNTEGKKIGIPRVLNLFENYPFWFTFFEELGFQTVLSKESTKLMYEKGIDTIPSESACYPAKLVHGHIVSLIEDGIDTIFYPCINKELKEFDEADNHFNCPVVAGYPELIRNNVDLLKEKNIDYIAPFIPYDLDNKMADRLFESFEKYGVNKKDILKAIKKGRAEDLRVKEEIKRKGEETLNYIKENNIIGIVLAGRPYHLDREINHGIDNIVTGLGMAVFTEDSIAHLSKNTEKREILNQWTYHARLFRAADFVNDNPNLSLVQINSFGCGIDAVTTDQVSQILASKNNIYTHLKIDEGSNMGAVKIRLRSLKAALENQQSKENMVFEDIEVPERVIFTKEMKENHTILCPQMSPFHFGLLKGMMKSEGYNIEVLPEIDPLAIETGVRFVNNDACYPTIVVVGQIMEAIESGEYDKENLSVLISQTGGGCRASNYIFFIRKALREAGYGHIPVISFAPSQFEKNPGFKMNMSMVKKIIYGAIYGDLLMRLVLRTRPYEKIKGSTNVLFEKWTEKLSTGSIITTKKAFAENVKKIIADFSKLERVKIDKPKVGIVGEILVKYHPTANNSIIDYLESEGVEVVCPDLYDFFLYSAFDNIFNYKKLSGSFMSMFFSNLFIKYSEELRDIVRKELESHPFVHGPIKFKDLTKLVEPFVSFGNQTGEGWLLTAEMIELSESGAKNIVCMQPFACLPNHITGKGMVKELSERLGSNIVSIDYDPGLSEVNQINRIKLMLSKAFKEFKPEEEKVYSKKVKKTIF
ncbi:MAG: 2-hydroxyglutaryl-CoA dehydratase [Clostridia bacterium]|nr:2-hydroxyglutaryl-CoA dehydratase [Clostridia bacterium]